MPVKPPLSAEQMARHPGRLISPGKRQAFVKAKRSFLTFASWTGVWTMTAVDTIDGTAPLMQDALPGRVPRPPHWLRVQASITL